MATATVQSRRLRSSFKVDSCRRNLRRGRTAARWACPLEQQRVPLSSPAAAAAAMCRAFSAPPAWPRAHAGVAARGVHSGWMLHNVTSVFDELCHSDPDCKSVETQCWLRPKGQYQNHLLIFHRHSFLSRAISSFVDSIVATTPSWQCAPPLSTNFGASPLERYRCVLWLPQDLRAIRL